MHIYTVKLLLWSSKVSLLKGSLTQVEELKFGDHIHMDMVLVGNHIWLQLPRSTSAKVVSPGWLLDQQKIQELISGALVPISLEDPKLFPNESGSYSANFADIDLFFGEL